MGRTDAAHYFYDEEYAMTHRFADIACTTASKLYRNTTGHAQTTSACKATSGERSTHPERSQLHADAEIHLCRTKHSEE